jgi:UDP-N-acetylmuramoyl-tripeptide--D-alanyl-D-alanine ligase
MIEMLAETMGEIALAVGGEVRGDSGVRPLGFSIDSRTGAAGDLFFAIVGPNHDGHQYVEGALAHGAPGAVVSDATSLPEGASGVVVGDTTRALQDLAISRRKRVGPKVIGITGSSGKTTTKEMTRQVLEGSFNVMATRGNLNNLFGLPLTLLDLESSHQVAVLEMGISTHHEMKRLVEIADPDVGLMTNLYGAHLESFSSLDDYAEAKGELFRCMRPNTTGVFNGDDPRCVGLAGKFHGYAVTFGMDSPSDFSGSEFRSRGLDGLSLYVRHGEREAELNLKFSGQHHAMNALAAVSAGFMLGCDLEQMASRLSELDPLAMRGRVIHLNQGVRILDDSYNANPAAVRASLAVISQTDPGTGRRLAVLGDMLELGEEGEARHTEIGKVLAASGVDQAILVGPLSSHTAEAARKAGMTGVSTVDSAEEAATLISGEVRSFDTILVKGSRGLGLESVVHALIEKFGESDRGRGDG